MKAEGLGPLDEPAPERVVAAGVDAVITTDPRIFGSGTPSSDVGLV